MSFLFPKRCLQRLQPHTQATPLEILEVPSEAQRTANPLRFLSFCPKHRFRQVLYRRKVIKPLPFVGHLSRHQLIAKRINPKTIPRPRIQHASHSPLRNHRRGALRQPLPVPRLKGASRTLCRRGWSASSENGDAACWDG